jgi:glycosyltransferase involved in cell wall biosynthesis
MIPRKTEILFFADRLPPEIGGMEIHAEFFISYFINHPDYRIKTIVSRDRSGKDILFNGYEKQIIEIEVFLRNQTTGSEILFFNCGRWIESLQSFKSILPKALFIYRTGGNEIIKAPLAQVKIADLPTRQSVWSSIINETIDILITNSDYTQNRLEEIGVNRLKFFKCIGGVDTKTINQFFSYPSINKTVTFVCCSRFVPYKNHELLINVFNILNQKGIDFELILIGDGPLLKAISDKVDILGLQNKVIFKGLYTNQQVLQEIVKSDYYIQFSSELETFVEGGSYIHAEGMGRSILEAISAGKFVITMRSGALPEIITYENGLLIDVTDPFEIAGQIAVLLHSGPRILNRTDVYSWENCFKKYEKIFAEYAKIPADN